MEILFIRQINELGELQNKLMQAPAIAIDTETTGLNPHADLLRLVQIASDNNPTIVIDCFTFLPCGFDWLLKLLTSNAVKIFQNAKFDLQFFMGIGIRVKLPLFDTMLAGQILRTSNGAKSASLASLCEHYLGVKLEKEEQKSDFSGELRREQIEYAAKDAYILLELREKMRPLIIGNGLSEVARLEFSCAVAVAQMEFNGINLDLKAWEALRQKTALERENALKTLYTFSGEPITQLSLFGEGLSIGENFDSNKQVLSLLQRNNIDVPDTSHHSLLAFSSEPIVMALLKYRHASKALSTFLNPLPLMVSPKTNRLHPHYGQIGAWSGRMSCGSPNIQQIPREAAFRACFKAPMGKKLVLADYSQIELRVAAQIAGDKRMIAAYRNGEDLHKLTASLVSGKQLAEVTKAERQAAKAVNFGLIFAMGAAGLQIYAKDTYGAEMTLNEAVTFRNRFFEAYSGINEWHRQLKTKPPKETRTLAGRKHIYNSQSGLSGLTNTPVQGSAADIIKLALGRLVAALDGMNAMIVAVVHDEILVECDEELAETVEIILKKTMENAAERYLTALPAVAETQIADSWAEK